MDDPEQQYFVDGMHEALITDLSKIGALKVISRTSTMRYRETERSIPEIAEELGVDALVEGSVLLADNDVRISAQLIDGATDEHLWAESYTRPLENVLALHSEISRAIAGEISVVSGTENVFRREVEKLSTTREVDPETYQSYLKGMFFLNQSSLEGTQKGMAFLREAVERSPDDPFAYAGLALGYAAIGHSPYGGAPEFRKASEAAARALELDDSIAEAQLALGDVRVYYEWDVEGAGEAFERALELSPNLAAAHYHYGWYLELVGRPDQAEEHMARAKELDPLVPKYTAWLAGYYGWRGRLSEAIEEAHRALELAPDNPMGLLVLGVLYQNSNRLQEAVETHERLAEVVPSMGFGLARLAQSYALAGRTEDANELIRRIESTSDLQDGMGLALASLALGDHDRAIAWLDYAAQEREAYFPWLLRWPEFEVLHDDPRFQDLAARYDLPGSSGHAT
jgi:TolB-like protein/tetratricopeptide (TPR) repeat protein